MKRSKAEKLVKQAVMEFMMSDQAPASRRVTPRRTVRKAAKAVAAVARTPMKIPQGVVDRARTKSRQTTDHPFHVYQPFRGVVPADAPTMAKDESITAPMAWAAGAVYSGAFWEGVTFLGYPYLAELAQRPEYRVISETIATEMTRKWIKLQATSGEGDGEDKTEKIKLLEAAMDRLKVREAFRELVEQDGFFGRSHLYLDLGTTDDRDELRTPIGDGSNDISKSKVGRGALKRIKTVEAVWCYPSTYNSNDPLKPDWYNPETWFVQGKELHVSRLLTFVGREVPDLLKPAYAFGGLSLSQMAKPYVDNWLQTRQSVSDLISAFSVMILGTELQESLGPAGDQLFARVDLFNSLRDNRGLMMINKGTEELTNVTTPLTGLDTLQAQSQEHMAAVSKIPLVKLLGIQPAGLNASSEGEIRTFYDTIEAFQEKFFRDKLTRVINFIQLSEFGSVDPEIGFKFEPLWSLDAKQMADVEKTKSETDSINIENGSIDPQEARARIAGDPDSPYHSLDPDEMPEPPEDEEVDETGAAVAPEAVAPPAPTPAPVAKSPAAASRDRKRNGARVPA